ncbi:MAG: hypothetical protein U0521_18230 [Anaerolineae bacterium]
MIYKVSYVILGGKHKGGIRNQVERPKVGDHVRLGRMTYEVIEVMEIMPPRDDFQFLHATARPLEKKQTDKLTPRGAS